MGIHLPPPPANSGSPKPPSKSKKEKKNSGTESSDGNKRKSVLGKAVAPQTRTIHTKDSAGDASIKYVGNTVHTTKFTVLTFLPKGLYEQFRRIANFYFLLIAIISLTPVSPVNPITNVLPLVLVLAVSLAKEAFEDRKRAAKDREMNGRPVEIIRDGSASKVPWRDVCCGDIVKVYEREYSPADLVLLSTSNPEGVCYIETMNLDGETNLKIKKALKDTWDLRSEADLVKVKMQVDCELPNSSLYTFTGNLLLGARTIPLNPNQVLLRGCSLRNTGFILGLVVFTGHETKVMMNMTKTPSKRSTLERKLDGLILLMFTLLFCLCTVHAVGAALWVDKKYWYLDLGVASEAASSRLLFDPAHRVVVGLLSFLTAVTLFSSVIPISLYVSIELVKYFQSKEFIDQDRNMFYAPTNSPALARTSNLNEELGQIQYIFSDKTGTLTRNMMEFAQCSIAGVKYGTGLLEPPDSRANPYREASFNFYDERLLDGAWQKEPNSQHICEFLKVLAVCHTVLPEGDDTLQGIKYQAASPDEAALVVAAKVLGAFFFARTPSSVVVRELGPGGEQADKEYELLAVLEFNSTRKRQSVVVRQPDGSIRLYCKGADTVIQERLSAEGKTFWKQTQGHLEEFGRTGLRTLCLAYRDVAEAEYESWEVKYDQAKAALMNRAAAVDAAAEIIERNLILLGATAIEDKLQEGVGECIEKMAKAGIKLWVLTGDKMETAINIGYACRVLTDGQRQCVISSETPEVLAAEEAPFAEQERILRNQVKLQLAEAQRRVLGASLLNPPSKVALIMDGKVLAILLQRKHKAKLLALGVQCSAVICCRVSPLQKSQITRLVRDGAGQVTLAIGDGANDVSMIQAAHVGVGISGQEGMQAVMAADFALPQFRFLSDLLLLHGRWSYKRISMVVGYFFYKNTVFTLVQFWFNLYAAYSGQRFYDDWLQAFYNLLFTSLPVIALGLLDQDVSKESARRLPQLYREGQRNAHFTVWALLGWLTSALWQSVVVFYVSAWALSAAMDRSGILVGLWSSGTLAYTLIATIVNLRLLCAVSYHTLWHYMVVFGSILFYYGFLACYCLLRPGALNQVGKSDNEFFVIFELLSKPAFWLAMGLGVGAALLPDVAWQGVQRAYFPTDVQLIQEAEAAARQTRRAGGSALLLSSKVAPDNSSAAAVDMELGLDMQDGKATAMQQKARGGVKFRDDAAEDRADRESSPLQKKKMARRHTGFAFDSPNFESHFADEAEKAMIRQRYDAKRASTHSNAAPLTAHQAAVLQKKVVLTKRYSATDALRIHVNAAAAAYRASRLSNSSGSNLSRQGSAHSREPQAEITVEDAQTSLPGGDRRKVLLHHKARLSIQSNPSPDTEDIL